jgi:hypothetical protein
MWKFIVLGVVLVWLSACSSTPHYAYSDDQYCYQTTTIYTRGDNVSSEGVTECTDKPRVEHVVKDAGVASDCRISRPLNTDRTNPKYGETLLCRFTDPMGKTVWRPVNEAFAYPSFN